MIVPTSASSSYRLLVYALVPAVFGVLFLFHTYPLGLGDVYWHLNTGRWIWEHGALPNNDPFTYTLSDAPDARQRLILQGFWLAQLLFYGVHAAGGAWGLIGLKATLFVTLYWLVWRSLVKAGVEPLVALLVVLPLPLLFHRYDELRPQIFSFLGTVLVYMNLSTARTLLRTGVAHPKALIALPLILWLWANLHRGFILGWVVILVVLASQVLDQWRGVNPLDRSALRRLFGWCVPALLASLANPTFAAAFIEDLSELQGPFARVIDEYLPLADYARLYQQPFLFYGVLVFAIAILGVLVWRRQRIDPGQAFLFMGFAVAGFSTFRFTIFFVLMGLLIGIPQVAAGFQQRMDRVRPFVFALLFAATLGMGYLAFERSAWRSGPVEIAYVPERASEFIRAQQPPAPLFNAYEYGGYLGWRLAPAYRMFVDPRCLDFAVYDAYQTARDGRHQEVFERYGVNSVIFYWFTPLLNTIPELTLYLLMDEQWELVYADRLAGVFVRRDKNVLPGIDKAPTWDYLQQMLERTLAAAPNDAQAHTQLGRVMLYRGDVAAARQHFGTALQLDPLQRAARRYWEAIMRTPNTGAGT